MAEMTAVAKYHLPDFANLAHMRQGQILCRRLYCYLGRHQRDYPLPANATPSLPFSLILYHVLNSIISVFKFILSYHSCRDYKEYLYQT